MSVKRYDFHIHWRGNDDALIDRLECESGKYTLASDYDALQAKCEALESALKDSVTCIDDWLHTYAVEMCDPEMVAESRARIGIHGTIGYIALVQGENVKALLRNQGGGKVIRMKSPAFHENGDGV